MDENRTYNRIYAGVRLFDVPLYLDRTYTYYVPPEWEDIAKEGTVVTVPFGGGNRKVPGIITSLSDEYRGDYEIKALDSVSAAGPALNPEMMGLCRFLVSHTLCTFGEAAHTVVPPKMLSGYKEVYVVAPKEPDDKLSAEVLALIEFIKEKKAVTPANIKAQFGADAGELIKLLLRGKYIERQIKIEDRSGIVYENFVLLREDCQLEAATLRSAVQKDILEVLRADGRMSETDLSSKLGRNVRTQISALEQKGYVTVEKVETYRNPYITECVPKTDTATLSEEQKAAYDTAVSLYSAGEPKAMLLHGVTGSGKTRVIKAMIDKTVEDGRGVIVLVPEIALTPQTVSFFCGCYGDRVSVIHSALSQGERYDAWRRIRDGKSDIVIGTRSAVFAPLKNIGMIVIDEEQEHTYKSDTDPKYLAHEVASYRCKVHNAFMMLSSATPSFNSYYKAKKGIYTLVQLKNRYGDAKLPEVIIDDMRQNIAEGGSPYISKTLGEKLAEIKENNKQAIVFLNRRGYSSSVICRVCGESLQCPSCSVALTYHIHSPLKDSKDPEEYQRIRSKCGDLTCHYCGYRMRIPDKCPSCSSAHFRFVGCGTQQAEEEIKKAVPDVSVIRMDYDTTKKKDSHRTLLADFRNKKAQVLLGTQMVTKGHDFPDVRVVGVMNADAGLMLDDYRAAEKSFSMLTQVIGRAGRADGEGLAVVQTLNPKSEVLRYAAAQDYEGFYENEIKIRRALNFPPFCDLITLTLSGTDESLLSASAVKLNEYLQSIMKDKFSDVPLTAYGPFEAPVYKVQNVCRMRMVFKCKVTKRVRELVADILCEFGQKNARKITISADINPTSL